MTATREPASGELVEALRTWWDRKPGVEDGGDVRVDLFVRSLSPPVGATTGQESTLRRLQEFEERELIDGYSVNVWGERICLCDTCRRTDACSHVLERIREFERWGEDAGASASEFFERRTVSSSIVDETYETIVPPRLVTALYVDGSLAAAFPCRFGDGVHSVGEFLDAVEGVAADRRRPDRRRVGGGTVEGGRSDRRGVERRGPERRGHEPSP